MLRSLDIDKICVVDIDDSGVRFDFVQRGCGYYFLRQDQGCYNEIADVSPLYSSLPYVSGQPQRHLQEIFLSGLYNCHYSHDLASMGPPFTMKEFIEF